MNFLKRAWLSITRRTGKSLLLFLIVLILGNAIAGAISIQQAARNVEKKIKSEMGAAASIQLDYVKLDQFWQEHMNDPHAELDIKSPQADLLQTIGASAYVKYYDYSTQGSAGSEVLQSYIPPFLLEQEGMVDSAWDKYYAFTLSGVQYHNLLSIDEGVNHLVAGRVFTPEEIKEGAHVAIVSKQLADLNQISLEDTIVLKSYVFDYENYDQVTGMPAIQNEIDLPLKVIGLIERAPTSESLNQGNSEWDNDKWTQAWNEQQAVNTIYLANDVVNHLNDQLLLAHMEANPEDYEGFDPSMNQPWYEPIYILNNPEDLEPFKEEVAPLLPEFYAVVTAADDYKNIAAPVEQTSKMANYILIVALIASILIVTLVVLLFLRDRKHEMGIYLSLGEKKSRVLSQIVAEVLIIAIIAITCSVFTGNLLASGLSSSMIQAQIEKEAQNDPWGSSVYYSGSVNDYLNPNLTTQDVVSAYEIRLTPTYILVFYLVSLGTIFLSTIVPMIYIVRLNPRKIMM